MISFYSSDKQELMTDSGNKDLVTITSDTPVSDSISTIHEKISGDYQ